MAQAAGRTLLGALASEHPVAIGDVGGGQGANNGQKGHDFLHGKSLDKEAMLRSCSQKPLQSLIDPYP